MPSISFQDYLKTNFSETRLPLATSHSLIVLILPLANFFPFGLNATEKIAAECSVCTTSLFP
jgi:hypothetical protein